MDELQISAQTTAILSLVSDNDEVGLCKGIYRVSDSRSQLVDSRFRFVESGSRHEDAGSRIVESAFHFDK